MINKVNPYSKVRCTVVGDVMLDHYIFSRPIKISSEAPILICRKQAIRNVLGGAANVAANVKELGAEVQVVGVIGSDYFGQKLCNLVNELHIQSGLVIDKRPTTVKIRILSHSQQIVRLDTEIDTKIITKIRNDLLNKVKEFNPDVIVVSDYLKGVISLELLSELKKLGKIITANPKPQNILSYKDIDIITLNRNEAYQVLKLLKNNRLSLKKLRLFLGVKFLIETRGSEGLIIYGEEKEIRNPAEQVKVYDVCGAGDSVIAIIALERFLGTSIDKIGMLSNFGASTVVKQLGTRVIDKVEFFNFRETLLKEETNKWST